MLLQNHNRKFFAIQDFMIYIGSHTAAIMTKFIDNKIGAAALSGTVFKIDTSFLDAETLFSFVPVVGVFPIFSLI